MVLLDVTISYNGTQFGGLEVYKMLTHRYGASSILAYSSYITDDLLKNYGLSLNFLEKDIDMFKWAPKLSAELRALRKQQSCFVAMPFDPAYTELFRTIKSCVEAQGYQCVRIDFQAFTKSIVEKIYEEIKRAKLVIFVAAGQNPNVFYEAGYAIALEKEVVTITDTFGKLPFDVRDRSALAYGSDYKSFKRSLSQRLSSLTNIVSK